MKSQVLHTVWCNISGEAAGEIGHWSLLRKRGLTLSIRRAINFKFLLQPHKTYLQHTIWRTWFFIAYSDERWLCYQFSLPHIYISFRKVGRVYFLNLGVRGLINGIKCQAAVGTLCQIRMFIVDHSYLAPRLTKALAVSSRTTTENQ